ncbi:GNAT family N-acetyltransferase [Streptomyces sp. MST-110588]|uniref:GNAT family N-acetyltransferase n=1 Tax=Streptomyces sp. MST-110588 TaxID=2833628 RepID=UPI001F5C66D2|nr:GNAT family N-acetyltransferase [Streptomyces sp. MST-110588]UNO39036.1 GNAT family N-acetyltransferase [Streptomyces sp. MST-110588]
MTTTLRPDGPEERHDDGGRARTYDVCVNSRPVGRIRLSTDPRLGPVMGLIETLEIDGPDRRRGRGTVAALAAEEVLRGWGCRQIALTVPADAPVALRLAAALGYTERSRRMLKRLGAPPELPEGSRDRALGEEEYPAWLEGAHTEFVRMRVALGVPRETAERQSADEHRTMLPRGPGTPGHRLRVLAHHGTDVGSLWVALRAPEQRPGGYVFDVRVAPGHRGRGHGRTLMLVAERECLAAGQPLLGLRVYADNAPARGLYESLGYTVEEYVFGKPLL